jgi:cyclopropane-fatty-acyl-phospholipid synthase
MSTLARSPVLFRPAAPAAPSALDRLLRRACLARLGGLAEGRLALVEPDGTRHVFGPGGEPAVTLTLSSPRFWRAVATGGSVGAGESYIAGDWRADDLVGLVRLFVRNREALAGVEGGLARLFAPAGRMLHRLRDNTRAGSRRNIHAHYDLGNDFYALWLDPSLTYSCALFERPDLTLEQAQMAKVDALLDALELRPGERLLEIGTGWGALAERAARRGALVTTTTISAEQHAHARERIRRAGLSERVTLLQQDWRDLTGRFDKAVSVEMVEAVGARHLPDYLAACARLLQPHGRFALQAITIQDRYYEEALRNVDFIQRHVFPGAFIPSVGAILGAAARTDLRLAALREIGPHYVSTLRAWRERFLERADEVRALGFPETFLRLWEFYLAYCEGGFAERQIGAAQLVFDKPRAHLPRP